MSRTKSVALLIETSNAYARGLLSGIASYIHESRHWSIYMLEQERGAEPPAWLKNWDGDGLIARIENNAIATVVRKLKIPVVDVSAARQVPNIPWIETGCRHANRLLACDLKLGAWFSGFDARIAECWISSVV